MKKTVFLAAVIAVSAVSGAWAKNFAVPAKNPVATITIPDTWKSEEIEYGYNAKSPDDAVFFSVEYATGSRVDKMIDANTAWMKENKIIPKGKAAESDVTIGGLPAHVLHFDATDEDGDTLVDFVLIPAGENRLIMLTLWGSEEDLTDNKDDIQAIQKSIKAIN